MDQFFFMPIGFMFSCIMHLYANFEMCPLPPLNSALKPLPSPLAPKSTPFLPQKNPQIYLVNHPLNNPNFHPLFASK